MDYLKEQIENLENAKFTAFTMYSGNDLTERLKELNVQIERYEKELEIYE